MLRPTPVRVYVAAWVPLIAAYAVPFAAAGRPLAGALRVALVSLLPFLLLGLVAARIPRRVPWPDEGPARFLAVQLGLAAAFALAGTAGVVASWNLDSLVTTGRGVRLESMSVAWQAVFGGLIYLVIAAVAYAWDNGERIASADALRARADLAALRSQLNPHFLLNTLHVALGLVRRDPALAERALERLGEVLHYGLRMHREALDEVALADEWAFVRSYLEIERLRFEDRLQLQLEADPAAMEDRVPPFVLQPLVENAIVHAVAPRKTGGRVAIAVRRDGDWLRLEVCDDGPGMPANKHPGSGLGLQLLRERLALLYAGGARLSLQPRAGGGLRATIDLPLDRRSAPEPA